jgi:hypothetical protein
VLSLKTGPVSPQLHVKYDNVFQTSGHKVGRFGLPTSRWQALAGFTKGTISITKPANPAEKLTKELERASRVSNVVAAGVGHQQDSDDIAINNEAPIDDMEEATVAVEPDPGDKEGGVPISQNEPTNGEPAVTTRSGRKV